MNPRDRQLAVWVLFLLSAGAVLSMVYAMIAAFSDRIGPAAGGLCLGMLFYWPASALAGLLDKDQGGNPR